MSESTSKPLKVTIKKHKTRFVFFLTVVLLWIFAGMVYFSGGAII